jgi:hypothetical protein
MAAGILIGKFLPGIPDVLEKFQYAGRTSRCRPLWIMIFPMMMKIDFQSIKNVRNILRASSSPAQQLVDQAIPHVRTGDLVFQGHLPTAHPGRLGAGLLNRGCIVGRSALHSDGVRMESSDKRRPGAHTCAGFGQ